MSVRTFKGFGVVTISLDLLMFVSGLGPALLGLHSSTYDQFRMYLTFVLLWIIGSGLICLRKWAAVYFSLALFYLGLWIARSSIETVHFPLNLFGMAEGLSLMLPAFVTVCMWRNLLWRGEWFF